MRLVAIGVAAGFFGALFGVGGGIIVVPLLMLVLHLSERPAMATSLAAIGIIALVAAASYAPYGDVEVGPAALVGFPAALGAVAGSALQQRLAGRTLALGFAVLLAAMALRLLFG